MRGVDELYGRSVFHCPYCDGWELRGQPLNLLRHVAHQDVDVEDVAAFGDRLHLRVREGTSQTVIDRLPGEIRAVDGTITELRSIPPVLEDIFIALSESNHD